MKSKSRKLSIQLPSSSLRLRVMSISGPTAGFLCTIVSLTTVKITGKIRPTGFQVQAGALQGYMIDKASADELGISNLGDLQDPEIAAVFDNDGDGKADLIGCNEGWACAAVIDHQLGAYELDKSVTHVKGDYSTLIVDTVDQFKAGELVLFYTWTPNWTVSELVIGEDVVWLGVPFSSLPDDPDADTAVDSIPGCLESPCDMGFGPNDIRVVANTEFLKDESGSGYLV